LTTGIWFAICIWNGRCLIIE